MIVDINKVSLDALMAFLLARAQLFDEAQLASAAIIAAEPWQEFRSSPQYKAAISAKKCKCMPHHTTFLIML